jgi:hypothetical protein
MIDKSLCEEHKPSRDHIKNVKGEQKPKNKRTGKTPKNKNKGNQKNYKFWYQDKQTEEDPKNLISQNH